MQLYAVNFYQLLDSLYMFPVFYTPKFYTWLAGHAGCKYLRRYYGLYQWL